MCGKIKCGDETCITSLRLINENRTFESVWMMCCVAMRS